MKDTIVDNKSGLENILSKVPYRFLKKMRWSGDLDHDDSMLSSSRSYCKTIQERHSILEEEVNNVLKKKEETSIRLKELKREGYTNIEQYRSIQSSMKNLEEELYSISDDDERLSIESQYDSKVSEKELVSREIVYIATEMKFVKERNDALQPLYHNLRNAVFMVNESKKTAELYLEEIEAEISRCRKNIRSGINPYKKIKRLNRDIGFLADKSEVSYITDVSHGQLTDYNKDLGRLGLNGKGAQVINDDYVGSCIDFLEQANKEFDYS